MLSSSPMLVTVARWAPLFYRALRRDPSFLALFCSRILALSWLSGLLEFAWFEESRVLSRSESWFRFESAVRSPRASMLFIHVPLSPLLSSSF